MSEPVKVDVYIEHVWHCPKCAERNCVTPVVASLNEEEVFELSEVHGISSEALEGSIYEMPGSVKCCECDAEFETSRPEWEDDE